MVGTPLRGVRGRLRAPSLALLFLLLFLPVRAHDIYSSWSEAKLLTDKIEVTITLARSSAHSLLPDFKKLPVITPETFPELAPLLRRVAPELLHISAAGKPLRFTHANAKIGGDADVTFTLSYERPNAGPLRFFARYLGQLVDGHVATLVVTNAGGDDLGWSPVTLDQPEFQVALPPSAPPGKTKRPDK